MEIKLTRPEAPRDELMRLLDALAVKRIIFIHASAGYGKTFSTRLWLKRRQAKYVWIALGDKQTGGGGVFCEIFARAILKLQPDNTVLKEIVEHPSFDLSAYEFTVRAIEALKKDDNKYIIVIDDLHLLRENGVLKTLPTLIVMLPECFTVFLLSRFTPPDSFSELIIKDAISLIDGDALKFSFDELKNFFNDCGYVLSQAEADNIYASTGGWAIGINAVLLSGVKVSQKKLAERHFEAFLKEQVWAHWDERLRDFMINISVVPELTPECAAALTGVVDSKKLLEELLWENTFISADASGTYRFHDLFRDFLFHTLTEKGMIAVNKQWDKAGDWFFEEKDYYRAARYYIKSGNDGGISKSLSFMYDYNSPYASIEDTLSVVRLSVDSTIVEKHPFLLEVQAWAAFTEGRADEFERVLDKYYKMIPKIVLKNPKSAFTVILLHFVDFRESIINYLKTLRRIPFKNIVSIPTPTISFNMPLFHRSSRDFSEFVFNPVQSMLVLEKTIGQAIGPEFIIVKDCLYAGFCYEKGDLNEAHKYAASANSNIQERFSPELKFCAKMILSSVYAAHGQISDSRKILDGAAEMIEHDKAYYLFANYNAYGYRLKLMDGNRAAAREWLEKYAEDMSEHITFYKSYRHFTTARALICNGEYNTAMVFTQKILSFCEAYHRPIDMIEATILLSITYWKKGRGYQKDALGFLEKAIGVAQEYGYTQIFANEGAELINMLQKIQLRVQTMAYEGTLHGAFVKALYLAALVESKRFKGLTGGRVSENLKFTKQQLNVMKHLCDGYGYKEIAEIMGLKYTGIKSHMQLICRKLDVPGSVEAALKIRELGILDG